MVRRNVILGMMILPLLFSCTASETTNESAAPPFKMVTPQHLFSVSAPDPDHVWIGGYKSTLMYSPDAGKTWAKQETGVAWDICSICFIDDTAGWAVGKEGTILHTTDGGTTWSSQSSPSVNHLLDVFFVDHNNGWIVGYLTTMLRTTDGGKTWQDRHQQVKRPIDAQLEREGKVFMLRPRDPSLNAVHALDSRHVWIAAEYGTILCSSDGGDTWQTRGCKDIYPVVSEKEWLSPMPSLYSIFFKDKQNGWAVGMDGVILHTADSGTTWSKLESPLAKEKPTLYAVKIVGSSGWALGQFGEYMLSRDGGTTWQMKTGALRTRRWLRDMDFADENNGWAVGERGTIVRTTDGGETWTMPSGMPLKPDAF